MILLVVFCVGVAGAAFYFLLLPQRNPSKPAFTVSGNGFGWKYPVAKFPEVGPTGEQIAYSDIRDPGGIPQGLPVRLQIPVISVDSAIEDALITPDGRMDVPSGSVNVAWFALGPHPGQVGSAVIGGHFGITNGVPFVFYNLDKLKIGDTIYIIDDRGGTLAFVVRSIKSFDRNADATTVFTSDDGLAHLNLITCEGIWNQVNGNYPQRLVIFTDAIPAQGAAQSVAAGAIVAIHRSLGIGAQGADVAALQSALEQKGLLTLPSGVTNGFFGALTRAAVAKYQAGVGLPSSGFFGPLTRARLISDLGSVAALPNAGGGVVATSSVVKVPLSLPQAILQSLESLYATLLDGLITSILLAALAFMAVVMVRRKRRL